MKFVFSFLLLVFSSSAVYAAEIYFITKEQNIYPDDIFVVEARVSSPDELINVADGSFGFNKNKLEVQELSVGGSIFGLWADGPSFSNIQGKVSFIGGTPTGFQGQDGLILKAIFKASEVGEVMFEFSDDFSVLLSDGKGTKIVPQTRPLALTIIERPLEISPKNEWQESIAKDTTPSEFAEAIIARDPGIFEGQYFISFFAKDEESGVLYYEVKEGDGDFIRAVSPYILQDQTLSGSVLVKAVDGARNESIITAEVAPEPKLFYKSIMFWTTIFIIFLIVLLRRLKRKM